MRRAVAAAILAAFLVPTPAFAGSLGVTYKPLNPDTVGVEAESGPLLAGWRLGALAQVQRYELATGTPSAGHIWQVPPAVTLWGRHVADAAPAHGLAPSHELGWLAGVNWNPDSAEIDVPLADPWRYVGPVVGVSYTLRSGDLWLRLTPNATFSPDPPYREGTWWMKSGIPWAEAGWRLAPGFEVSFRASQTFVRAAWVFD